MKAADRVRCVIMRKHRFLLAQHNSRRSDKAGKWGLPGGRLKHSEEPQAGLRRELLEELRLRAPFLIELGDCVYRGHTHRIFGCEIDSAIEWFDTRELLGIGWFSYAEVAGMAESDELRTGFELGAINSFRRHIQPLIDSSELWPQRRKRGRSARAMPWAELFRQP
jgi:8-oxo-dGTP pyrophosphatase MutT (NUDIX family)